MRGVYDEFYQTIFKARRLGVTPDKILKTLSEENVHKNSLMGLKVW